MIKYSVVIVLLIILRLLWYICISIVYFRTPTWWLPAVPWLCSPMSCYYLWIIVRWFPLFLSVCLWSYHCLPLSTLHVSCVPVTLVCFCSPTFVWLVSVAFLDLFVVSVYFCILRGSLKFTLSSIPHLMCLRLGPIWTDPDSWSISPHKDMQIYSTSPLN